MKKIIFSISMLLLVLCSCSQDVKKITITSEHVKTGEATDITATSAVISGHYNFFGAMSQCYDDDFFEDADEEYVNLFDLIGTINAIDSLYGYESRGVYVYGRNPDHVYRTDTIVIDTLEGNKTVTIETLLRDVELSGAGFYIAESRDFFQSLKVESVAKWDRLTKVKNISRELKDLKADTQYYYKTFLRFSALCTISVPELDLIVHTDVPDYMSYNFYGDTETFRTLPK